MTLFHRSAQYAILLSCCFLAHSVTVAHTAPQGDAHVFINGQPCEGAPSVRLAFDHLALNDTVIHRYDSQKADQRALASETKAAIEKAIERGDVLLFGRNYRIIKTGAEAVRFLAALDTLRSPAQPLATAAVHREVPSQDLKQTLELTGTTVIRDLQSHFISAMPSIQDSLDADETSLSPLIIQTTVANPVFAPHPHHFVILRPCNFHFSGLLGNDNGGHVWNRMVSIGYSGEDYIDDAVTADVFLDEIQQGHGNGFIFFHTHGVNEGLVVEAFRHSNYPAVQTTLSVTCDAGTPSIHVGSTAGFPESGNIVIRSLLSEDLLYYTSKTSTSFDGIETDTSLPDDAVSIAHLVGETVEWTPAQQAEHAAYAACSAYYATPDFDYGDLLVDTISASPIDPRPAHVLIATPQLIESQGALDGVLFYADACESAGDPDRSATELDDAFLAAGVENYMGYNVSARANWWLWWLTGNSPQMVADFINPLTDGLNRKTVGDAHAAVIVTQPNLIRCSASPQSYHQVLLYTGDLVAQTIPPEGELTFGTTYLFDVLVTNQGDYAEEYQINFAIHNSREEEIMTLVHGPVGCEPGEAQSVTLEWPVDAAHGVAGVGTYKIGIGLWPVNPDYATEPIIDVLGFYTYTVSSLPDIPVGGTITRLDNGQGLSNVSVSFSAGGGTAVSQGDGSYTKSLPYGWTGTLTPTLDGWSFDPPSFSISTPLTSAPDPVDFTAEEVLSSGILTDKDSLRVVEGSTGLFRIKLAEDPLGSVNITVARTSGDLDITIQEGASLSFNSSNWNTYQLVRLAAAEDADTTEGLATITCSAAGYADKYVTAQEQENDAGSMRVFIEPSAARSAGAQWRVDGSAWHSSGETVGGLPTVGERLVEFKPISGWHTPGSIEKHIPHFAPSVTLTGTYVQVSSETGTLQIDIHPATAVSDGAQWRVDGGPWNASGGQVHGLSAGSHTVEFSSLTGFLKPANQSVNVNGGSATRNLGFYSELSSCTYVSPGQSIQTAINAATAGDTVVLQDGTHNITEAVSVNKGIVLRSQNGPDSTTVQLPGTRHQCVNVGHQDAVVDGLTLSGSINNVHDGSGNGGGAACSAGLLINSKVISNKAVNGGGIYCSGHLAVIRNCLVKNNEGYDFGGGVHATSGALVQDCVIQDNYAHDDGGGIYASGGTIVNCLVVGNSTRMAVPTYGGGACLLQSSLVQDTRFVGNESREGGGIYFSGSGKALGCEIRGNQARIGGGFFSNGGTLSNCVIEANVVTEEYGGGGYCEESTHLVDCVLIDNRATYGAALGCDGQFGVIRRCIFSGNQATGDGGALHVEGEWTIENCLFFDNSAQNGGAIYNYEELCTYNNCTIVDNSASNQGGGLYCDYNGVTIRNSILYYNSAPSGANYYNRDTYGNHYTYCCSTPQPDGSGNRNDAPSFVNRGADNYRLQSSSACVDTGGTSGAPNTDLDGIPRPLDGDSNGSAQYDIGAYEYAPPSGSLIVRIDPIYAIDAGARWQIDAGAWYAGDEQVDWLSIGQHTVTFTNLSGWAEPGPSSVSISEAVVSATNGLYLPLSNDTDADELPDDWEIDNFGRLTNASFSTDFDGDKLTDYYELLSGTDPCDASSCIAFTTGAIAPAPGNGVVIRWYSGAGMLYRICRSTNLVIGFSVIETNVPATPPMNFYTDPSAIGTGGYFYQIQIDQ